MQKVIDSLVLMLQEILADKNSAGCLVVDGKIISIKNIVINEHIKKFLISLENSNIDLDRSLIQLDNFERLSINDVINSDAKLTLKLWEFNTNNIPTNLFQLYQNEQSFISAQKRAIKNDPKSNFPNDFYLIDENYQYSKAPNKSPSMIKQSLKRIRFFGALEKVADFVDSRTEKILYFKTSEKNGHLCSISLNESTLFNENDNQLPDKAFDLLEDIEGLNIESKLSDKEKRFVFSSSISEFLSKKDESERFEYLVKSWEEFNDLFNSHFKVYTDGKSINELKITLAEEQIKLSDNITKGIIDILSKILILPSLSALFIIFRQSISNSEHSMLIVIILIILLIIITISVCLTAYIHLKIIKSLEYSSKFLNKTAKDELKEDNELKKLKSHSDTMISRVKTLLIGSIIASVILCITSLYFLTIISKKTISENTPTLYNHSYTSTSNILPIKLAPYYFNSKVESSSQTE